MRSVMKRCPHCNHVTTDELAFCRADGSRLVQHGYPFSDSETVALPPDAPSPETTAINEALIVPTASRSLIDSRKPSRPIESLAKGKQRQIATAVAAAIVIALAASFYHSSSGRDTPVIESLAVLPFINVNSDRQLDYLSDGMTEMLICNLSQLPKLNVKARASVFRYKDRDVTPHAVGADLNVQ